MLLFAIWFIYHLIPSLLLLVSSETCWQTSCDEAFECQKLSDLTEDSDDCECEGYKSCYAVDQFVVDGWNTYCAASHSCASVTYLEADYFYCQGSFSCAYINDITGDQYQSRLFCEGAFSCAWVAYVNIAGRILCNGVYSCSGSTFHLGHNYAGESSDGIVEACGAYSLAHARLHSSGMNIHVVLSGYRAGHNLTVVCEQGDDCDITCYGNSCQNTLLVCEGNCIVSCDDASTQSCPIRANSTNSTLFDQIDSLEQIDLIFYDIYNFSVESDNVCNYNASVTADANEGRYSQDLVELVVDDVSSLSSDFEANICCRGHWSCYIVDRIDTNVPQTKVICSGETSCYSANITTPSDVLCLGEGSCEDTYIYGTSSDVVVYCGANSACFSSEIYGAKTVFCAGGEYSCWNIEIRRVREIYIIGGGDSIVTSAEVWSDGIGEMRVFLGANDVDVILSDGEPSHEQGHDIDINCNTPGDVCYIDCAVSLACSESKTDVFCDPGTTCYVACDPDAGIGCPRVSGDFVLVAPSAVPTIVPTSVPTALPISDTTGGIFETTLASDAATTANEEHENTASMETTQITQDTENTLQGTEPVATESGTSAATTQTEATVDASVVGSTSLGDIEQEASGTGSNEKIDPILLVCIIAGVVLILGVVFVAIICRGRRHRKTKGQHGVARSADDSALIAQLPGKSHQLVMAESVDPEDAASGDNVAGSQLSAKDIVEMAGVGTIGGMTPGVTPAHTAGATDGMETNESGSTLHGINATGEGLDSSQKKHRSESEDLYDESGGESANGANGRAGASGASGATGANAKKSGEGNARDEDERRYTRDGFGGREGKDVVRTGAEVGNNADIPGNGWNGGNNTEAGGGDESGSELFEDGGQFTSAGN